MKLFKKKYIQNPNQKEANSLFSPSLNLNKQSDTEFQQRIVIYLINERIKTNCKNATQQNQSSYLRKQQISQSNRKSLNLIINQKFVLNCLKSHQQHNKLKLQRNQLWKNNIMSICNNQLLRDRNGQIKQFLKHVLVVMNGLKNCDNIKQKIKNIQIYCFNYNLRNVEIFQTQRKIIQNYKLD